MVLLSRDPVFLSLADSYDVDVREHRRYDERKGLVIGILRFAQGLPYELDKIGKNRLLSFFSAQEPNYVAPI